MHDATVVRGRYSTSNLHSVVGGFTNRNLALLKAFTKCFALKQLRNQIGFSGVIGAKAVNGQNIRMVQSSGGASFLFESPHSACIDRKALWQQLYRNITPKGAVVRPVDLAHATGSQRCNDFAVSKAGTGSNRHCWAL